MLRVTHLGVSYAGRDLHPHTPYGAPVPETGASTFRHQRLRVTDRIRTGAVTMARSRANR
jgi:hypothetical protein